nr:hypothetical protein Iba_chr05fCG2010 [Ipomoea batatas]
MFFSTSGWVETSQMNHVSAELVVSRPAIIRFRIVSLRNLSSNFSPMVVSPSLLLMYEVKRSCPSSSDSMGSWDEEFSFWFNSWRFIVMYLPITWSRISQARLNFFSGPIPSHCWSFQRLSGSKCRMNITSSASSMAFENGTSGKSTDRHPGS